VADGKGIGLGYNRNRVIVDEEHKDGRLTCPMRRMKGGESILELRGSTIH